MLSSTIRSLKRINLKSSSSIFKTYFRAFDRRSYLSEAYKCQEAWDRRLQLPLFGKVKVDDFFVELDKKFTNQKAVSCVDIDTFANVLDNDEHFEELENILHRFRKTRATVHTLESTHCAVVRLFLKFGKLDSLLKILQDRTSYGIFPDRFSFNLVLDGFLKKEDFKNAAKVATLMMLQEDFGNHLGRLLALYACHMYLRQPERPSWNPLPQEVTEEKFPVEEEEDEEVYVRIPFLLNPWFDDHFDLQGADQLIGKTLSLVGKELGGSLGLSYQLIGLGMYGKWKQASQLLEETCNSSGTEQIFKEALECFKESLKAAEAPAELESIQSFLAQLGSKDKLSEDDLHAQVLEAMKVIPSLEQADIRSQEESFLVFWTAREEALRLELERLKKREFEDYARRKRQELKEKEELLFFFENWNRHEMELADIEEEERTRKNVGEVEEYFPPEIWAKENPTQHKQ